MKEYTKYHMIADVIRYVAGCALVASILWGLVWCTVNGGLS